MTSSPTAQQLAEAMRTAQAGDGKAYHQRWMIVNNWTDYLKLYHRGSELSSR